MLLLLSAARVFYVRPVPPGAKQWSRPGPWTRVCLGFLSSSGAFCGSAPCVVELYFWKRSYQSQYLSAASSV